MFHNVIAKKCATILEDEFPLQSFEWKELNQEFQEISECLAEVMAQIVPLAESGTLLTPKTKVLCAKYEDITHTKDQLLREKIELLKVIGIAKKVLWLYNQKVSRDVNEMKKRLQTHFVHVS
jgi:hypothetical protein